MEPWYDEVALGLTGAFLCSQAFGSLMVARSRGDLPLGRMACEDEYGEAMVFLCSGASSYRRHCRAGRTPHYLEVAIAR